MLIVHVGINLQGPIDRIFIHNISKTYKEGPQTYECWSDEYPDKITIENHNYDDGYQPLLARYLMGLPKKT